MMSRFIQRFVAPTIGQITQPIRGAAQQAQSQAQTAINRALQPIRGLLPGNVGDAITRARNDIAPQNPFNSEPISGPSGNSGIDFSAASFLSKFKNDVFRGNRFLIEFNLPAGIDPATIGANRNAFSGNIQRIDNALNSNGRVSLKCHTATYPQRSLLTSELNQNSAAWRVPYSASYDPITFSFYADGHLDTRRYFELWQSAACNFSNNTMNFLSEYCVDIQMHVLDRQGNKQYGITLVEAWPMNVGSFDVTYSSQNVAQTITVTMAYKQWVPRYDTAGGTGAVGRDG